MTFKDLLRSEILEGFRTNISTLRIVITLVFATILGLYIFFVYRYKTRSTLYSRDFNNALRVLPVITAGIVLSMQASIVISLGMVGALSIIRFRNAVKNSLDLTFLFWSISCGIVCGAGIWEIALLSSAVITIVMFALDLLPVKNRPYLLVLNAENIDFDAVIAPVLKENSKSFKVKSKAVSPDGLDVVAEVRTDKENRLVARVRALDGVVSVTLLTNDGEERRSA